MYAIRSYYAVTNYESYYDYVYINDTLTIPILEYVYPEDLEEAKLETAKLPSALKYFSDTFIIYPFSKEKYGQAQFGWGGGRITSYNVCYTKLLRIIFLIKL